MTGLDAVAWTIGYVFIVVFAVVITLSVITIPVAWAAKRLWHSLTSVYEFYVLKWWFAAIKESGRTIPTKKNVEDFYKGMEE